MNYLVKKIYIRKKEYKYVLVKKIERILKESAIDCPINYNGNVFKDELNKYKNCEKPIFEKNKILVIYALMYVILVIVIMYVIINY